MPVMGLSLLSAGGGRLCRLVSTTAVRGGCRHLKRRSQPSVTPALKAIESPTCEEKVSLRNMGVLQHLQMEARKEVDPKGERWGLFDRNSPNKINTGSLIKVSYRDSRSAANVSTFTGVLLAIRRSTGAPTIHVRGIIDGVAVEQVFCIFSPLLRDVQVLKTLARRTDKKFYYLRERPHEIGRLQNLSNQLEQQQQPPRTAGK